MHVFSTSTLTLTVTLALATTTANAAALSRRQFGALGSLINGLSPSCIGNIGGLALSGDLSDCLGLPTALSTFTALGSGDSLVQPVQDYLASQVCPRPACAPAVLADANNTLNSACTPEDRASNDGVNIVAGLSVILDKYTAVRNVACLKQATSQQLCLTDTLTLYQQQTNSNVSLGKVIDSANSPASFISGLPDPSAFCTSCVDAISSVAYGTALGGPLNANSSNNEFKNEVSQRCGPSFNDGTIPSDVVETAGDASSTSSSSSSSTTSAPTATGSGDSKSAAAGSPSLSSLHLVVGPLTLALGTIAGAALLL